MFVQEAIDRVEVGCCEGECEKHGGHEGLCELCEVTGHGKDWKYFSYCQTAQRIDTENGFSVELVEECETCQGEGTVLDYNKFTLDKGKFMRSFEEIISMECPDCEGRKYQVEI